MGSVAAVPAWLLPPPSPTPVYGLGIALSPPPNPHVPVNSGRIRTRLLRVPVAANTSTVSPFT